MGKREREAPTFPGHIEARLHDGPLGSVRSRTVGQARADVPDVVMVQGMAVSDYLLPSLGTLGSWTRTHLVDLPGLSGSGEPTHELDVAEYAHSVADWVAARRLGPVILGGHSSGTQVAARAAVGNPDVAAVVLASPTIDPAVRSWVRLLTHWWLNGRHEPPGLGALHRPEWVRAGPRRLFNLVRTHLHDTIEESVRRLRVPVLVIRGGSDRLSSADWARSLAELVEDGHLTQVPGAHSFPWRYPTAWRDPIRRFAAGLPAG